MDYIFILFISFIFFIVIISYRYNYFGNNDLDKIFIFKVKLANWEEVFRVVAVSGAINCEKFMMDGILKAFEFDNNHPYSASFGSGRKAFKHPLLQQNGPNADKVKIADLKLKNGNFLNIVYELADEWTFIATLLDKKQNSDRTQIKILETE